LHNFTYLEEGNQEECNMKEVTIERIAVPWYMQYILEVLKEKDTHRRILIGDFMLREKIKKIYRKGSTKSGKPKNESA